MLSAWPGTGEPALWPCCQHMERSVFASHHEVNGRTQNRMCRRRSRIDVPRRCDKASSADRAGPGIDRRDALCARPWAARMRHPCRIRSRPSTPAPACPRDNAPAELPVGGRLRPIESRHRSNPAMRPHRMCRRRRRIKGLATRIDLVAPFVMRFVPQHILCGARRPPPGPI